METNLKDCCKETRQATLSEVLDKMPKPARDIFGTSKLPMTAVFENGVAAALAEVRGIIRGMV